MRITSQVPTKDQPTHIVTSCILIQFAYAATSLTLAMGSPSHSRFPCLPQHNYFSGAMRPCVKRKAGIGVDNLERMLEETWQGRCLHSPSQACPCYWNTHCPIGLAHNVSIYQSSNYKTNTGACYLLFQALFNCQSVSLTEHASF